MRIRLSESKAVMASIRNIFVFGFNEIPFPMINTSLTKINAFQNYVYCYIN